MPRLLHQYCFFGGEKIFSHMMARAMSSFAEMDEFVYSSLEFLEEYSGAASRVKMNGPRFRNERDASLSLKFPPEFLRVL